MKAWTSLTDTSAVKTYREVPALRNNAFREFVVVVCVPTGLTTGFCRDAAKIDKTRRATLTKLAELDELGREGLMVFAGDPIGATLPGNGFAVSPNHRRLTIALGRPRGFY
jgi:hypothetical protein